MRSPVRPAGRDGADRHGGDPNFLLSDGADHGGGGGVCRVGPPAETRTGGDGQRGEAGEENLFTSNTCSGSEVSLRDSRPPEVNPAVTSVLVETVDTQSMRETN